jgi:hypothetical protein
MASEIDICNLALSHLGDEATVASISPPEGSVQAEHCARFYPMARDSLLSTHPWGFSTRRAVLAPSAVAPIGWAYAYVKPADALVVLSVITDGAETPQAFQCESDADGTELVFTDQAEAVAVYSVRVEDAQRFPPLFVDALTWWLASMLAGPIIKGSEGRDEAKRCREQMRSIMAVAKVVDSRQRTQTWQADASGIVARR